MNVDRCSRTLTKSSSYFLTQRSDLGVRRNRLVSRSWQNQEQKWIFWISFVVALKRFCVPRVASCTHFSRRSSYLIFLKFVGGSEMRPARPRQTQYGLQASVLRTITVFVDDTSQLLQRAKPFYLTAEMCRSESDRYITVGMATPRGCMEQVSRMLMKRHRTVAWLADFPQNVNDKSVDQWWTRLRV